jgi:thiol-disulfide isomerase/thioredoxin
MHINSIVKHRSTLSPILILSASLAAGVLLTACKRNPSPGAEAGNSASPPATAPSSAAALPVIGPAPYWQLVTLDGKAIGTEQLKGKVVVVDFWATWCGPCVYKVPGYIALQKKYADRGLVIVGLSVDQQGADLVSNFISKHGINYPVALATTEVINAFGDIEGIPTTLLIDREGNIRHRKAGAKETADYEKLITSVL